MRAWKWMMAGLVMASTAGAAWAQQPRTQTSPGKSDAATGTNWIQTLFFGDVPYSQSQGSLQVNIDGRYFNEGEDQDDAEGRAVFEYGITDRLQVGGTVPYLYREGGLAGDEADGFGDVTLSTLYNFWGNDAPLIGSVQLGVALPTGDEDEGLGREEWSFEPQLLLGHHMDNLALYADLGYSIPEDSDSEFVYAFAGAYKMNDLVGIVELSGRAGDESEPVRLTPGAAWIGPKHMQLFGGVPIGLNDDAADWGVIAKLVLSF